MISRPNVEIKVESGPVDINKTGYDEEPAKYMANKPKGFWKSIKEAFGYEPKWLNNKGLEPIAVIGIVAGVAVLAAVGFLGMAWSALTQLGGQ